MSAMDKMIDTLSDNPWWIVGAGVIGLVFLSSGRRESVPAQGFDPAITLASQEIAANAGVALAGIQVQREGIASEQKVAAIQAMRDVNLGAQQFAIADKSLRTQTNLAEIASRDNMGAVSAGLTSDLIHVIAGHQEAIQGFNLQKAALESNERLGLESLINDRNVNATNFQIAQGQQANERIAISRGADVDMFNASTQRESVMQEIQAMIQNNILDFEAYKYGLPFEERADIRDNATIQNLAWRQKQIAKQGGMFNLFNSIIGAAAGLGQAAIGRGLI